MWQVLESQTLVDDPHFQVIKEKVQTNNGQTVEWYRLGHESQIAGIIARNEEGKILLLREYTYPLQDWVIDLPGGGVPDGEDIAEGANRELIEEGGYSAGSLVEIGSYISNRRRSSATMHLFLATGLTAAEGKKDEGEEIETFWVTENELDEMIRHGEIASPRLLTGWLYYKLHTGKI